MTRLRPVHSRLRARPAARSGLTQIEVIISTLVMSILVGTLMGMMLLACKTVDSTGVLSQRTADARDVAQQMSIDLSLANNFTERTDKAVAFTVPDRDGNGQAEAIRYAWSGAAGDPLTREYNGQGAVVIAEDVHHLDLTYLLKTVAAP